MRRWILVLALAAVFSAVGAFATSVWLEVRSETPASRSGPTGRIDGRSIRVEVLNGAGTQRLAQRATERLRRMGFDVVYYGNADSFGRDSSVAIARVDDLEPARRVADALGVRQVELQPDANLYLDVTLLLGADWSSDSTRAREPTGASLPDVWIDRFRRGARRLWPGRRVDGG